MSIATVLIKEAIYVVRGTYIADVVTIADKRCISLRTSGRAYPIAHITNEIGPAH
jgi:hypothetical protein